MADASRRGLVIGSAGQDGPLLVENLPRGGDLVTATTPARIAPRPPRRPFAPRPHTQRLFACAGLLFPHESPPRREGFVSKKIVRGAAEVKRGLAERIALGDLEAAVDWGYAPDFVSAMRSIVALQTPDDFVVATGICHTVRAVGEGAFSSGGLDYREPVQSRPDFLLRCPPALL